MDSSVRSVPRREFWTFGSGSRKAEADLVSPHRFSIRQHILVVLFHVAGEAVMSLGVGDEIVIIGFGGMHGRLKGTTSGIRYGAGRESYVAVGVVGGGIAHVRVMQSALIAACQ